MLLMYETTRPTNQVTPQPPTSDPTTPRPSHHTARPPHRTVQPIGTSDQSYQCETVWTGVESVII